MKKTILNWSSGKDSVFAMHLARQNKEYDVQKLITTLNSENHRVSMHGVRFTLVEKQAEALNLPVFPLYLKLDTALEDYNQQMEKTYLQLKKEGFLYSMFGDILLEDLKEYREKQLNTIGITAVFPLWKRNTQKYMQDFLASGYRAIVTVVNNKVLDASFCGRIVNEDFLNDLPKGVDPAGENGEFHTFVFDGPDFKNRVEFEKGEKVQKLYAPSGKEKDCYQTPDDWDTQFTFIDLTEK